MRTARTWPSAAPSSASRTSSAASFRDMGYGYGYAFAQDNICTIAQSYVTIRAERSRFFGPDESWKFEGNGSTVNNLNSDFFFKRIIETRVVEKLLAQKPPNGPAARDHAGRAGLRGGLQPLPARHRRGEPARPHLPRQGVGAPDHRDRRLPLLLQARAAGQLGRGDRRDRRRAAAHPGAGRARQPLDVAPDAADPGEHRPLLARRPGQQRLRARQRDDRRAGTGWCSATRTSRGRARSASTSRTSPSPARPTWRAPRCSACRSC